jgi:hypothetical protein
LTAQVASGADDAADDTAETSAAASLVRTCAFLHRFSCFSADTLPLSLQNALWFSFFIALAASALLV